MEENQKKVALVTGASSGIGRAISARLLALGYEVYGIGRQFPAELPEASVNAADLSAGTRPQAPLAPEADAAAWTPTNPSASEIAAAAATPAAFHPIVCDLLDTKKLQSVVAALQKEWKQEKRTLTLLVNNAGTAYYGLHEAADAKSSSRMSVEVAAKSSGNYTFRLVRVRFYGLLGIGYLTRYVRYEERLSIMPKITPVMIEVGLASRYFQGAAEVYDDKTGGDDVSEVFQIRSFQPGDKIQNIHWKLSAKEDELMVRENSLPMGCPVVILLDISGGQKETGKQRNHFFEMVISISFGLVEKQCPHYIAWYDEKEHDLIRVRVDTEECRRGFPTF